MHGLRFFLLSSVDLCYCLLNNHVYCLLNNHVYCLLNNHVYAMCIPTYLIESFREDLQDIYVFHAKAYSPSSSCDSPTHRMTGCNHMDARGNDRDAVTQIIHQTKVNMCSKMLSTLNCGSRDCVSYMFHTRFQLERKCIYAYIHICKKTD
jgi:hypothetical protein